MPGSILKLRAIINGRSGKLLLVLVAVLLLLMAFPKFVIFQSMAEYLGLHSLLELLSIIVALLVALSVFYSHEKTIPSSYAITGSLFLLSAFCDALHVFSYPGMPDLVSPGTMNKAVFFWLIGRSCAIAGLLSLSLMPRRAWSNNVSLWYGSVTVLLAAGIAWLGLGQLDHFPTLFIPDSGLTTFKIGYEWVLAILSIIAGYRLLHIKSLPSGINTQTLAAAAWITALAEICFTLYTSPYDEFNVLGHIYKAISYALVFHAVFIARLQKPYRQLEKIQRQLVQSEQRWKFALDGSGTGVWDLNVVDHRLFVSAQLIDMLGYRADELGSDSRGWWDLIHPDDLDGVRANFDAHLRGDIPEWHMEHRMLLRNGQWRWVLTRGSVMERDHEGNPLRMLGTQINIQKRKEQEQLLMRNKARLRAVFEAAPLGMVVMDDKGVIQAHNAMLATLIGRDEMVLEGTNLWQWVAQEDAATAHADWHTFIAAGQEENFHQEYRLACSGHGQRWMEWIVTPLPGEGLYLCLIEDIDARRREAALLEENAQLYRGIFQSSHAVKMLFDSSDGQIVDANTAAADYYGYPLETLKKMSLFELMEGDGTVIPGYFERVGSPSELHHLERRHRLADGTLRDVDIFTGPVRIGGRTVQYNIIHDITDRKQAEQALNLVNMRLQRQSESRQRLNQLGVMLQEAVEPDEIVTLLQDYLPSCFDGAQGELLLTLEEFSFEPVRIIWGEDSWDIAPFCHVETLRVGAATLGQLVITASLNGAEECERFEQLASECAKMIALMLVNLRLRRQLTRQAYRDSLTGLYNRRHLDAELPILLAKASAEAPLSLALIDLDHFKRLNDTYGHDVGDEVLRALARILENSLRSSDIPCRYGGEEFVVVMPGASAEIALNRLDQILKALSAWHFDAHGERIEHLTFSAGLIEAPRQGVHMANLLEQADRALYAAKHAGRGRVLCASEILIS